MEKFIIFCDGGSIGNPGPSAIGVIIKKNTKTKKYSLYLGKKTNNEAEYLALIFALKKIKSLFGKKILKKSEVICSLDSKLVFSQISGKYKIKEKKLQPLFIELWNLKTELKNVKFILLEREKNKEAHILVKKALKKVQSGS